MKGRVVLGGHDRLWGSSLWSVAVVGIPSCLAPDLRTVQRRLCSTRLWKAFIGVFSKP
jgi:hypothetical protein